MWWKKDTKITNEGLSHPMEIARCLKTRHNSIKNRPHDHKTFELRVSYSYSITVRSEWAYLLDMTFWLDVFQEWVTNHVLESFVTIEPGFTTLYSTLQRLSSIFIAKTLHCFLCNIWILWPYRLHIESFFQNNEQNLFFLHITTIRSIMDSPNL